MSKKSVFFTIFGLIIGLAVAGYGVYGWQQRDIVELQGQVKEANLQTEKAKSQSLQPVTTYTSKKGVVIKVYTPAASHQIASPLVVLGEVPGSWSFEASFPVQLKNSKGETIAHAPAQLIGDWMTDKLVPFTLKLEYPTTESGTGSLVLQKDNPSGLPENDDQVSIPVVF